MRQLLQELRSGELLIQDVAAPRIRPGHVLVRTRWSLISAGTERMLMNFSKAGYLQKARQQPEKVKQVLEKIRTDGLVPTIEAVRDKLDQPLPLGYCNVGTVLAVGEGVEGLSHGDLVASNGPHAEIVLVPRNLCTPVPEGVDEQSAAFTVVGAIGLQGVRLLQPTLGESVVVFGLGLIGLMAVQFLKASGTRVLGFDYDPSRVELARMLGVEAQALSKGLDPVHAAMAFSRDRGVDAVLITASTQSHKLIHQAAQISRKRGRIVLTGVVGLNLQRADFYEKELTFQVSCSYGPGRYDPAYEEGGQDYPIGFVRWTEQRNFEAVLDSMACGVIHTEPLISEVVPFDEAPRAYKLLATDDSIGILLRYPEADNVAKTAATPSTVVTHREPRPLDGRPVIGIIGAGAFTQSKILPALSSLDCELRWIASSQGTSGSISARRFRIANSTTDSSCILEDPEVDAVFITTRHDSHADYVIRALEAGKHVFVEKPLCINREELEAVRKAYEASRSQPSPPVLMVGFNRRFAPLVQALHNGIRDRSRPLSMQFICNAGEISSDHWVHDPVAGGGRIIGEACHFVDLLQALSGARIVSVDAIKLDPGENRDLEDSVLLTLGFADGSLGSVSYLSTGAKSYPKEHLLVFGEGRVFKLENFRKLKVYGSAPVRSRRLLTQDKGHRQCIRAFLDAVRSGGESPVAFDELYNTMLATIAAVESMRGAGRLRLPGHD